MGISLVSSSSSYDLETLITPEHFAEILCSDMKLPNSFISHVARSIREQLEDYKPFLDQRPEVVDPETGESLRITIKASYFTLYIYS
jgi:hypothetical protein